MSRLVFARICLAMLVVAILIAPGCICPPKHVCPPPEDDLMCTGQRWIGILQPTDASKATCPVDASGVWTSRQLFEHPKDPDELAPTLGRYCVFEWTNKRVTGSGAGVCFPYGPNGPSDAEIAVVKGLAGLSAVADDCIEVAPLASFEDGFRQWTRDSLWKQAGGFKPLQSGSGVHAARLVAADTSPDALVPPASLPLGNSLHGDTVAHLAGDLACPDGSGGSAVCGAHLATALALPRYDLANPLNTDAQGGFFGTEGDLAEAIKRLAVQWRQDVLAPGVNVEPRLVVNLSLGWEDDPERSNCAPPEGNPESLAPPARAVLDAMRYAVCHGALILAAAGNDTGGPDPKTGMVCPARWEQLAPPTASMCDELIGAAFLNAWQQKMASQHQLDLQYLRPPSGSTADDRIVYAVGSVDHGDELLVPVRPSGLPRLAALGLLSAAWDRAASGTGTADGGTAPPPPLLTGTSVATAVTSAVAAAVWAYKPELTGPEIIENGYQSGLPLQAGGAGAGAGMVATSGTCAAASGCAVHRLSLCRALKAIPAAAPGGTCAEDQPLRDAAGALLQNPPLSTQLNDDLTTAFANVPFPQTIIPLSTTASVPHNQLPSIAVEPWSFPQPLWPGCPACVIRTGASNTLVLYAKPAMAMSNFTVVVVDGGGIVRWAEVAASTQANVPMIARLQMPQGAQARKTWISGRFTTSGRTVSISEQIALTDP